MALLLAQYAYIIRDGVIMIEGSAEDLINDSSKDSFLGGTVANKKISQFLTNKSDSWTLILDLYSRLSFLE